MFKKLSSEKPAGKPLFCEAERKKIDRIVKTAKRDDGIPRTAQQTIPFERMFADGTCRVRDGYYTHTIQFQDINYQLALQEDKTAIFEEWCSFLNFFDSSVHFEFSFVNMAADAESFERSIRIPPQKDGFDDIRAEYSQMLKTQLAQGNNGLTKTKYLTFGIEAASMRQAKPRLDHLQNDILNNFRRLGAAARVLNGWERLRLCTTCSTWMVNPNLDLTGRSCPNRAFPPRTLSPPALSLSIPAPARWAACTEP